MQWLISALAAPVLNFLWDKIVVGLLWSGGVRLTKWTLEFFRRKSIVDKNKEQADLVEELIAEIKAFKKAGKPVPPELDRRLVDESKKIPLYRPYNPNDPKL